MAEYRRYLVPGGAFFFTVVTQGRAPFLCTPRARQILRSCLTACRRRWPFRIDAIVLLPDHLHTIWSLPPGDGDYSRRWALIKKDFTKAWLSSGGCEQAVSTARAARQRRGVWQPRFWEHNLRDPEDFERHADYIHYNPVRHGLVSSPSDWLYSSFHRWVRQGSYDADWGCGLGDYPPRFDGLAVTATE